MGNPHGQGFGEPVGGSNEKTVGKTPTRVLLADITAPEAAKTTWIYSIVTNPVYGGFSMNVLADFFVRILLFIATVLTASLCSKRARKRERIARDLEEQRKREEESTLQQILESWFVRFQGSQGSPGTPTVLQVDSSTAQGSSTAPPPATENHAQTTGSIPAVSIPGSTSQATSSTSDIPTTGSIPGSVSGSPTSSTNAVPTEPEIAVQTTKLRHRNGFIIQSRSMGDATSTSSESPPGSTPRPHAVAKEHHVIDMTFSCRFPSLKETKKGDKFKETVKETLGVDFGHDVCSSRMMQARVPATEENLSALREVAIEGMKLDKGFTLQIGSSFLYCCNDKGNREEPLLLSLRDVEVPTVLQAEYSAGMLTVRGRYLEGAEIRAATSEGYMIFKSVKQDPIDNDVYVQEEPTTSSKLASGIVEKLNSNLKTSTKESAYVSEESPSGSKLASGIGETPDSNLETSAKEPALLEERIGTWRCTDLLPPVKLDQIQIFASKRVHIEGLTGKVTVRSEVCSIQNTTLRTVIYKWVPTIIIMNILVSQLWGIWKVFTDLVTNPLHPWLSYPTLALTMYIIQLVLPSWEENVNYFIERLKLAISSFHIFPKPLASPTFFMHDGFCFQRGATYLIPPSPREGHDKQGKKSYKKEKGNLITKIDWKWPCSRWNTKTKKYDKIDLESSDYASNFNDNLPFEVLYGQGQFLVVDTTVERNSKFVKSQHLPKDIVIKLYSKHLQNVVRECLPDNMKQFENYGEIQAMDLLIAHLNGKLPEGNFDLWSNLPSTSLDEHGKNDLHMFHLTRFLDKEYANTIKQYKRMMKAGIISWDMLWTLIVPGIDVIYPCQISKQELCGKVYSVNYEFSRDRPGKFAVELEVYDFDCNNFVVVNVIQELYFFKNDMKIVNLDTFPLQCKANPQELEERLFQRGRIFSDLVLKYERQFMHYKGVMYEISKRSSYTSISDTYRGSAHRKRGGHSIKASIDGRVMIDQKWFAKLKSKVNMGTARASGWNPLNEWSEMRIKARANEFDSLLKYSPAIAYGYSFSIRKWGCFNIVGFSKIQFVSTAFDKLVMSEENKLALVALTEYYINNTQGINNVATHIDILPNKGQGCIIVLHGPPGTGKTLTVESLAERLECPLWQLSISKLTASTKRLENKVLSTFEVAKSWGAILVLDEADVYLSSRIYSSLGSNNTQYNAMTGVFLRVLEHYKGVLFLTTNVMSRIEPAIFSRISMFIKYKEFNIEERKKLWSNFLEETKISHLSEDFWKKVLPTQFNGRVIRNIIHRAQILIQSKNFEMETPEECLLKVFDTMTIPSTMNYLVESHEADQSTPEVALSIPSAPTDSFVSDLPPIEPRD